MGDSVDGSVQSAMFHEQKILKGHLPRVKHHQVYEDTPGHASLGHGWPDTDGLAAIRPSVYTPPPPALFAGP